MSRNINVNPAHYKLRGRERQGEDVLHAMQKQAFSQQAETTRWQEHQQAMAPPHPPEQVAAEQAIAEEQAPATERRSRPAGKRKAAAPKRAAMTRKKAAPRKAATRRRAKVTPRRATARRKRSTR